jgi:hypothetical protein
LERLLAEDVIRALLFAVADALEPILPALQMNK